MYRGYNILQLRNKIDKENITPEEIFNDVNKMCHLYQSDYNSFVTIIDKFKMNQSKKTLLSGIPYALKDNISTSGILTTSSSNILKDYIPVYNATVYQKLRNAGAVLTGKTVLDELAMGGTGTTGHTGIVRNPWDKERMIGGSSAGSASIVALGLVPFSIGSDTGDSIRKPASFGGVVGFKPTYGRISRYGLFGFASSLDHVGVITRNIKDCSIVMDVVKGQDPLDMTSIKSDDISYLEHIEDSIKGKKLFYIKEICDISMYEDNNDQVLKQVLKEFYQLLEKLRQEGFIIEEVSIDKELLEAIYPTYMSISCAEATSNNANLTGIQFGPRPDSKSYNDLMFKARTEGFSELIKRRFVLGSYILQKENQEKLFLNACRIRRLIVENITDLFKNYDGMILPASGGIAPKFNDTSEKLSSRYLILENHLCIANFGGFPSITLPFTMINNMPVGVNLTGRVKEDNLVLNMANYIEKVTGLKDIYSKVGEDNV